MKILELEQGKPSGALPHFEVIIPKRRDGRQETEVKMKSLDLFETKAKTKLTLFINV